LLGALGHPAAADTPPPCSRPSCRAQIDASCSPFTGKERTQCAKDVVSACRQGFVSCGPETTTTTTTVPPTTTTTTPPPTPTTTTTTHTTTTTSSTTTSTTTSTTHTTTTTTSSTTTTTLVCTPIVPGAPIPNTYTLNGTSGEKRCTTNSAANRFGTCTADT